jgi:hypothetical protein
MMAVNSPDLKQPETLFNKVFFSVKEEKKFRIIKQIIDQFDVHGTVRR